MSLFDAIRAKQPLIFGHRGASAYAPMNTIPAFELAAELGADGVELDVHRSADGNAVLVHDFTVDATTDGTGRVTSMRLDQLKVLDAGSWKDAKFTGVRIPTLDEVFEAVGDKLFINVEIKSVSIKTDGVEALIAEVIRRHRMESRVIVSSFNPLAIRRFRKQAADIPVGFLVAADVPRHLSAFALGMPYEAYHPYEKTITAAMMTKMKNRGIAVNTWTVNDPERARELAALGVNVIISDVPDVIRDALNA